MNLSDLNERFSIPGILHFGSTGDNLTYAQIEAPHANARLFLQGAHLASWQPERLDPVLYLSPRSQFVPGTPVRGGIPVVFPWFGPRAGEPSPPHTEGPGPSHGFARTSEWQPVFAAMCGDELHLTLALGPTQQSRSLGFDHFRIALALRIGHTLSLELAVANNSAAPAPLVFEEALHTYLRVADATQIKLLGLSNADYIDKRDDSSRKLQPDGPVVLTEATDRIYLDTESAFAIEDPLGHRRIILEKAGSRSTVVWNPWSTLTPTLPDMDPGGWRNMVCVETANIDRNAITLAPGETHTMSLHIAVEKLA